MDIIKNINGEQTILVIKGRLDTTTAPELEVVLNEIVPNAKTLYFDFSELEYLSSAGLRLILSTQKSISANAGSLIIKNVNDTIMEVFEMTGFSSILTIE